jgi:AhpD family alkylhydroperoxidase
MADDVHVVNRRFDASENEALIGMARMGADAFGYTADLRIDRSLAQLLRLRVSQLNNCTYCLNLHYQAAREAGGAPLHRGAHPRRRHRSGRGVPALPRRARRALRPGGDARNRRRRRQHEHLDPDQACRGRDGGPGGLSSLREVDRLATNMGWPCADPRTGQRLLHMVGRRVDAAAAALRWRGSSCRSAAASRRARAIVAVVRPTQGLFILTAMRDGRARRSTRVSVPSATGARARRARSVEGPEPGGVQRASDSRGHRVDNGSCAASIVPSPSVLWIRKPTA